MPCLISPTTSALMSTSAWLHEADRLAAQPPVVRDVDHHGDRFAVFGHDLGLPGRRRAEHLAEPPFC
jgi:hypothetical protein